MTFRATRLIDVSMVLAIVLGLGALAAPQIGALHGRIDLLGPGGRKNIGIASFSRLSGSWGLVAGGACRFRRPFQTPPQVRSRGVLTWHGILVSLDPDQTLHNSHADALHRCGWWPWDIRTPFYDGVEQ